MILLVDFHVHFWLLLSKRTHLKSSLAKMAYQQRTLVGLIPSLPPLLQRACILQGICFTSKLIFKDLWTVIGSTKEQVINYSFWMYKICWKVSKNKNMKIFFFFSPYWYNFEHRITFFNQTNKLNPFYPEIQISEK